MSIAYGDPCLISSERSGLDFKTVCGINVDLAVFMQAMVKFGPRAKATKDLDDVRCRRCLAEVMPVPHETFHGKNVLDGDGKRE